MMIFYPNPYDVLEVAQGASKMEINQGFKKAIQKKKYPLAVISQAHKCLLNSQQRLMADYLRPYLPMIHRFKRQDLSALAQSEAELLLLLEFDGLEEEMEKNQGLLTPDDQLLGQVRFARWERVS
jgi:hypothetical protein